MIKFHLFRIKIQRGPQKSLFDEDISSSEILLRAIRSKPSEELRKGHMWHIGNVKDFGKTGIYFALGRTTSSIVERYDDSKGDFIEEEFETAPYTHVILDHEIQVAAISKKTKLAPTVKGIANQLEKLINNYLKGEFPSCMATISQINDPDDFLKHIRQAYAVTRFSMDFGLPNPWDVEKDFQKPMEDLLKESDGDKGKTTVDGNDLNRETLEKLTRSAATSGCDAQAIMILKPEEKKIMKRLRDNPAVLQKETMDEKKDRESLLKSIRIFYKDLSQKMVDTID